MVDIKLKKTEAADFLNRKGRRIEMIFFGLVLVFVSVGPLYLYSYLEYLLLEIYKSVAKIYNFTYTQIYAIFLAGTIFIAVCVALFTLFVTMPIYTSFFDFSYKMYRDGACGRQRYLGFGKRGYWGAFRAGWIFVLIFALSIAPVVAIVIIGKYLVNVDDIRIVALVNGLFIIVLALGFVIGFFIFVAFKPLFLFGYYIAKGKKNFEALSLSVKQMKKKAANEVYFAYIKSFIPSLLLSLATLLIFFFVDTLPKMMMVYFDISEDIAYCE